MAEPRKNFGGKRQFLPAASEVNNSEFPVRRPPTLGSIDSYIYFARDYQKSIDDTRDSVAPTAGISSPVPGINSKKEALLRPSTDARISLDTGRKRQRPSKSSKRRSGRRTNASVHFGTDNRYAGIGHSDLDIQTARPPLMHQMNFIEWFWFRSGSMQRIIFISVAVLFVICVAHFVFALVMLCTRDYKENPYICNSDSCHRLSKRLVSKMNKSVNPCDDFYAFVCGSSDISTDISEEEDEYWSYGSEAGEVTYNYDNSKTLGNMLKKTKRHPDNLVLDMYQACLDQKQRNKLGLQPYFDLLKLFGLDKVSLSNTALKGTDVIHSMAQILSHSLHSSAIINVNFYVEEGNKAIKAYIVRAVNDLIVTGSVPRYGYKLYHDTIQSAFRMMKQELQITTAELDILPHDIVCLEMYFRDNYRDSKILEEIISDSNNVGSRPCDLQINNFMGVVQANFGLPPSGGFDFTLLIRKMFKISNPSWDENSPKTPFGNTLEDPTTNARTDQGVVDRFAREFSASAPIRFLRYLQWRVFYNLAAQLNDDAYKIMINIQRNTFYGKSAVCFTCLFTWLPLLAPNTFLQNSGTRLASVIDEFTLISDQAIDTYQQRARPSLVANMEKVLGTQFTNREKKIIHKIIMTGLRAKSITPVEFNENNFKHFRELYNGIKFERNFHMKNILRMGRRIHEWRTGLQYQMAFFGNIPPDYQSRIFFDRSMRSYDLVANTYKIYLPMALAESPFSNDGLHVSGLSGLGMEFSLNLEAAFIAYLVYWPVEKFNFLFNQFSTPDFSNQPVTEKELWDTINKVLDYHKKMRMQFIIQIEGYKVGNKDWHSSQFRYKESTLNSILSSALHDQSRHQAMTAAMVGYLSDPTTPWQERKAALRGLEEYNLRQIFFILIVNRRCEKLGPKKFKHTFEHGPLPQAIRNNMALSNLDEFAAAYKCPVGSPMNPEKKIYFWERNFRASKRIVN